MFLIFKFSSCFSSCKIPFRILFYTPLKLGILTVIKPDQNKVDRGAQTSKSKKNN